MDQFINNEEPRYFNKEKITRKLKKVTAENFEPEEAFLKIGFNMRQALKKHPPMGMLEGIEEKITETFTTNPNSEFVAEDMSSFERLLLHALCSYNSLNSYSEGVNRTSHDNNNFPFQVLILAGKGLFEWKTLMPPFFRRILVVAAT